ncbi:MAG TPA: pyrroline-5-carboxylate reductase [Steroidobacteraceae bacterium]
MSTQHLAVLGGGNMGRALIGGLLRRGTRPEHIGVGEPSASRRADLSSELGVAASADNLLAIQRASLVVLAVKPQDVASVLAPLRPFLERSRPLVVSIAAGIRLRSLASCCGARVPVVRAMPNAPALVGAGTTALFAPSEVSPAQRTQAERAMQAVGEVVWVASEDELDVVTALSGSGPAYFFLLAELMSQGGIALGLDPAVARRLAVSTLHGAGQLVQVDGELERLRAAVTSPGGTTEAALQHLQAANLPAIIAAAMSAATRRSRELAAHADAPR